MDKTAIKTFAINSRKKLMEDVEYKMSLVGITKDKINKPITVANGIETYQIGSTTNNIYDDDISKRKRLVKEVNQKGFENVVEEVAYTWFNRIIAIRFMEINNFLPTKTRVLCSETSGKIEPDIITDAFDVDLDYTQEEKELIFKLKNENKLDELFRFLFIKQCNKLNEILPGLFEKTDDYLELLLNISFTNEDGVVRQLIDTIPEEDFGSQVEIIGWLYQFYNSELKDETFANLKKRIKISKERIPAATQLFTPDWIVKYMVENSVGRLWLEGHPNEELKSKWKYFVDEAEQEQEVEQQLVKIRKKSKILKPEDIRVIDPCMGSGHILVYVFEVLMDIYVSEGFTEKDACESILKHNLYGLDIDKRAYQLAYFAVLMKARKYNRRILTKDISPLLCSIEESNSISEEFIQELILQDKTIEDELEYIISSFIDAKEYGSILKINKFNFNKINRIINDFELYNDSLKKFKYINQLKLLKNILNQSILLSQKYDITITNPPYMGNKGMDKKLNNYLKNNFKNTKKDLSTVFMEKSFDLTKNSGFISMINIPVWMFISSYENLRKIIIKEKSFINMLHLGRGIFGSDFGTTTFIIRNSLIYNYKSIFKQLYEDKGAVDSISKKEKMFFNDKNNYYFNQNNFNKIPGKPIAYWVNNKIISIFENSKSLADLYDVRQGLATTNNKRFLRRWSEVNFNNIGLNYSCRNEAKNSGYKWFPYNKGGNFKKWFGNQELVVNWENDGFEIKEVVKEKYKDRPYAQGFSDEKWEKLIEVWVVKNINFYFKESITWTFISSSNFGVRYSPPGSIFDVAGSSLFPDKENIKYLLGFLCSKLATKFMEIFNPTLNFQVGDVKKIPIIINESYKSEIDKIVSENIFISKNNWDMDEQSWNFKKHHLIRNNSSIKEAYEEYCNDLEKDFYKILKNEERLNEIFIDIYDFSSMLNSEINIKEITLSLPNYNKSITSFISYAVGCMFGRYSLDNEGLQFAGGEFNINNYSKFVPDDDNIIPILDSEYFEDDIVGRFIEFVKTCFGEEYLEENLNFIADALITNKKPSRERIRDYLLKNFFNEHKKTYKKCPLYWQFSSGKQKGFNCLVYMHRYEPSLVARIRTDYLHKTQKAIEQAITNCDNILSHSSSSSEIAKATKDKNKLQKQLKETQEYDEALAHIANQNIIIDLDDGVKVNYSKFQNVEVSKEGEKAKKINLLTKI